MWLLGIEPGSSGRVAGSLNHGAISPAVGVTDYKSKLAISPNPLDFVLLGVKPRAE